jgi:hypothetical protein
MWPDYFMPLFSPFSCPLSDIAADIHDLRDATR